MIFDNYKGLLLERLQKSFDLKTKDIIDNGANDLSMFKVAGTIIAFNAKLIVKEAVIIVCKTQNLREILQYV